jgi:hypothetical protein
MYVLAWPLSGNVYVTIIRNDSVTTYILTVKIYSGIIIYPGNDGESDSSL